MVTLVTPAEDSQPGLVDLDVVGESDVRDAGLDLA
jgi:hypothetical protein